MKNKQNFLQGAIILTVSMISVKFIGAFFKLPLAYIITENGMGYFNTAYNFYAVIFSLATAGFPVAIAKMVAENITQNRFKDVRAIKSTAFPIFLITGLIGFLIMFFSASFYTDFIGNKLAFYSIISLSPTIFFCCLNSIYRGYFEGLRNMYPTAISQIIEALSKLLIGLSLAYFTNEYLQNEYIKSNTVFGIFFEKDEAVLTIYAFSSAFAILGVSIGSFLSFLFLNIYSKIKGDGISKISYQNSPKPSSKKHIAIKLFKIAVPIAIGSLAMSITTLVDQTFLQKSLSVIVQKYPETILEMYQGKIPEENLSNLSSIPNFLFGCFAYASTIFMLVPALTQALGTSALPNLTHVWVKGDKKAIKNNIELILRITSIIAFPIGLGISAIPKTVSKVLYGDTIGIEIVSDILAVLGVTAVFCAITIPISSMLQAIGKETLPVKILLWGLLVKLLLNYILCSNPIINVHGASLSSLVSHAFICVIEIFFLKKCSKIKISLKKTLIKPMFCAIICCTTAKIVNDFTLNLSFDIKLSCLLSVMTAGLIYVLCLLISKTMDKSDFEIITNSNKKIKKVG